MEVNNAIYDALGRSWWSKDAGFEITSLRYWVNPVRYGYFRRQLQNLRISGKAVLDIGCGGGFLAESFARDGFEVVGIDPSRESIEAASEHASKSGLHIGYRVGRGESLPFPDGSFDIVACCDVLEHVDDPRQVIREVSRTLRCGGIFFFDTVNRTRRSELVLIKIWQDWNLAGFSQPNLHVWEKFIKPDELADIMRSANLVPQEMKGIGAASSPFSLLYTMWRIRTGRIRADAIAGMPGMRETGDLSVSYMGWALKEP